MFIYLFSLPPSVPICIPGQTSHNTSQHLTFAGLRMFMEADDWPLRCGTHMGLDQSDLVRASMTRWNSRSRPIRTGLLSKRQRGMRPERCNRPWVHLEIKKIVSEESKRKNIIYLACLLLLGVRINFSNKKQI